MLTYLTRYFGVDVRQIEYAPEKALHITGNYPSCGATALYAAHERIKTIYEKQGREDWESYWLIDFQAQDYVIELAYSLILVPVQGKSKALRAIEREYAS